MFAEKKGRSKLTWFFLCLIFPPIILVLIALPPQPARGGTKRCPYCSNAVGKKDTVCRSCNKELPIDMVRCGSCGSFVPDKDFCIQCNRKLR